MIGPFDPAFVISIDEPSKVGEARRIALGLGERIGLGEERRGRLAIVATEAATNLIKHAGGGVLIVQEVEHPGMAGVELLAIDKGPGMVDVGRSMEDGYSTAGSAGNGLGAVARLSDEFDLHTQPSLGTVVLARFWSALPARSSEASGLEYAAVSIPYPGEPVCGDAWAVAESSGRSLAVVVDGLGHGLHAAEAAQLALEVFRASVHRSPAEILAEAHSALRSTRGAAMAIAAIDREKQEVCYAGVGNIAGALISPGTGRVTNMVSRNGIVGHTMHKAHEFLYPWARDLLLVMNSDGLTSHWQLERYAGLMVRSPGVLAGVLYRDFARGRDDLTVLVARERGAQR